MKSKQILAYMLITILVFTACTTKGNFSDAEDYLAQGDYNKAIDLFNQFIFDDPTDYPSWFGLVDAYMGKKAYDNADDTLSRLFNTLVDNRKAMAEDETYYGWIHKLQTYVDQLIIVSGHIGSWFTDQQPDAIDLHDYDFGRFRTGETITLIPQPTTTVHYDFNTSDLSLTSPIYTEPITLDSEGDLSFSVMAVGDNGLHSDITTAQFSVGQGLTPPTINYESGTYVGPITLYFDDYNYQADEVFYTLTGEDPRKGTLYAYGSGKVLSPGTYTIQALSYSHEMSMYSPITSANITVTAPEGGSGISQPVTLRMVSFDMPESIDNEIQHMAENLSQAYEDISIDVLALDDLFALDNMFKGEAPPDLVYTDAAYAIDLYTYIGDISNIVDIDTYKYYEGALDSSWYWDAYYTLPVVALPEAMLYRKPSVSSNVTYTSIEASPISLLSPINYDDLLAFYYGNGGLVENELGYLKLNHTALTNSLIELETMANEAIIDPNESADTWRQLIADASRDYMVLPTTGLENRGSYTPTGLLPKPNGFYALYPMKVYGLMASNEAIRDPYSDQAEAIALVADYMINDPEANHLLTNPIGGLPAIQGLYDPELYETDLSYDSLDTLMALTPGDSLDLRQIMEDYVDYQHVLDQLFQDQMSADEAAREILRIIDAAYLP